MNDKCFPADHSWLMILVLTRWGLKEKWKFSLLSFLLWQCSSHVNFLLGCFWCTIVEQRTIPCFLRPFWWRTGMSTQQLCECFVASLNSMQDRHHQPGAQWNISLVIFFVIINNKTVCWVNAITRVGLAELQENLLGHAAGLVQQQSHLFMVESVWETRTSTSFLLSVCWMCHSKHPFSGAVFGLSASQSLVACTSMSFWLVFDCSCMMMVITIDDHFSWFAICKLQVVASGCLLFLSIVSQASWIIPAVNVFHCWLSVVHHQLPIVNFWSLWADSY